MANKVEYIKYQLYQTPAEREKFYEQRVNRGIQALEDLALRSHHDPTRFEAAVALIKLGLKGTIN